MDNEDRIRAHFRAAAGEASADDLLLARLRQEATARTRRRRAIAAAGTAVAATVAILLGFTVMTADEGDDRVHLAPGTDPLTTLTTPPSTTPTTGRTTPTAAQLTALDWDDVRFDIGIVRGLTKAEQGTYRLSFDRVTLDGKSAPDFTQEPVAYGNTDQRTANANTRLRDYRVRPNAEVLRLANPFETCAGGDEETKPPRWETLSLADASTKNLYEGFDQTALTFDTDGFVTRIRLSKGC